MFVERNLNLFNLHSSTESATVLPERSGPATSTYQQNRFDHVISNSTCMLVNSSHELHYTYFSLAKEHPLTKECKLCVEFENQSLKC